MYGVVAALGGFCSICFLGGLGFGVVTHLQTILGGLFSVLALFVSASPRLAALYSYLRVIG